MHHFTSDLHLDHRQVLQHDKRPFSTIEEHDQYIIDHCRPEPQFEGQHNELWILGDVAMSVRALGCLMEAIRPRWQKIHLIRGNHDDRIAWRWREFFDSANEALYLRIDPQTKLYLSHYAHRVWRNSHHGSLHVHGHSHGALPPLGRSIDACVILHDYRPISEMRISERVKDASPINHHDRRD